MPVPAESDAVKESQQEDDSDDVCDDNDEQREGDSVFQQVRLLAWNNPDGPVEVECPPEATATEEKGRDILLWREKAGDPCQ